VPPVVTLFLVGLFWRGANASGAAATLLLGSFCGLLLFLANVVLHWSNFHFLYATPILVVIDATILVGVSLATRQRHAPCAADLIWNLSYLRAQRAPWRAGATWSDYRVHAAVMLLLCAVLVIAFR
jgi:SSS family solute:Na+ symporter